MGIGIETSLSQIKSLVIYVGKSMEPSKDYPYFVPPSRVALLSRPD